MRTAIFTLFRLNISGPTLFFYKEFVPELPGHDFSERDVAVEFIKCTFFGTFEHHKLSAI